MLAYSARKDRAEGGRERGCLRAYQVPQRVVLLEDLDGGGVGDLRVLDDLDSGDGTQRVVRWAAGIRQPYHAQPLAFVQDKQFMSGWGIHGNLCGV